MNIWEYFCIKIDQIIIQKCLNLSRGMRKIIVKLLIVIKELFLFQLSDVFQNLEFGLRDKIIKNSYFLVYVYL